MPISDVSGHRRKSRAVVLLTKTIAAGWFDLPRISAAMVADERTVEEYLAGTQPMPLERQLCLAQLLIEQVPALARQGHNLASQVRAEAAYIHSQTVLHQTGPVPMQRTF